VDNTRQVVGIQCQIRSGGVAHEVGIEAITIADFAYAIFIALADSKK
jgi:hypothetical protein